MPWVLLIWIATGANTSSTASESTKVPSTTITTAITSSTIVGLFDTEVTNATATSLNCKYAISQPDAPATAMIADTIVVVIADSTKMPTMSRSLILR